MSHPFNEKRAHKVDRERVGRIAHHEPMLHPHTAKYRARGGHVDAGEDEALIKKTVKKGCMRADGGAVKARADKAVRRAKGGRAEKKGHGKTNVNVIVAPGHGAGGPSAPMPAMAPPMPPRPPVAAPPPPSAGMAGPPPVPAAGPGGMPPRSIGGRAYKTGGAALEKGGKHKPKIVSKVKGEQVEADGGGYTKGTNNFGAPARRMGGKVEKTFGFADMSAAHPESDEGVWGDSHMKGYKRGGKVEGKKSLAEKAGKHGTGIGVGRTPIQHSGNKNDTQNVGRGPVITKATGGPIYSDGRYGKEMGPDLPSGNSGIGRRAKAHMAKTGNWSHRGQ